MSILRTEISNTAHKFLAELGQDLGGVMNRELFQAAEKGAGIIRETINREWLDRSTWKLSTGNLARSFKPTMLRSGNNRYAAGIFSDVVYAAIHEDGGTIYPSRAKNLAIPLTRTARRVAPMNFPKKLRFAITPLGNKVLAIQMKTKIKPQYLLEPSVQIRGKKYLSKSAVKVQQMLLDDYPKTLGRYFSTTATKYMGVS